LKVNPRGEVPCLVVGNDKILNDSSAILVYLAGKYGDGGKESNAPSSYWSRDLYEQAQIINWVSFLHKISSIATPQETDGSSTLKEIIATGRWYLTCMVVITDISPQSSPSPTPGSNTAFSPTAPSSPTAALLTA
jgi:hypothetical protein